ncbi:thiolase family protein [Nocardia aurea]|uniref:thiolase family protein n=1 Tax=Nocardia aurea TaxID=2144174 RepID=UPI0018E58EB7|nr:thiolase family protein [Nocardia aurea]
MIRATVAGAFATPFTKVGDDIAVLGARAVRGLLQLTGADRADIDVAVTGTALGGTLVGQRILKRLQMTGIPVINVENACATGATAVHVATQLVTSGRARSVIAVGAEQLSALGGGTLPLDSTDIEATQGSVMPAVYAMRASRYLWQYGVRPEEMAQVTVKNRQAGALNPIARFQDPVTLDDVLSSPMVCDPLTLLQCSSNSDGAAAVLVCSPEYATELTSPAVDIRASVVLSGAYSNAPRDLLTPDISVRAVGQAYAEAGITAADVDVAEVHDAFTIAELLYYETLGFCAPGEGAKFLAEGGPLSGGSVAVNPSGGLIARGHPVGATGVAQIVEVYQQLTGAAGARQVRNSQVAVTHVTGGGIAGVDNGACSVHVLAN